MMPTSFERDGVLYHRVTIRFAGGHGASQARAWVHDVLIRAHGFSATRHLTRALAVAGGRFRVGIARSATKKLKRRLMFLVEAGLIDLYVAGRRVA